MQHQQQQPLFTQMLQVINNPDNSICADCKDKKIDFVSVNLGVFLCGRCANIHSTVLKDISQVKPVKDQTWTEDEYMSIASKGNMVANAFWESQMPSFFLRPHEFPSNTFIREYFISSKYQSKEHIPGAPPLQFITQGWLFKSNPAKKEKWLSRWFVLSDDNLSYFQNKTDSYASGVIPVSDMTVSFSEEGKKAGHCLSVKVPGRDYKLWTEDPLIVISWIHCLRQANQQLNTVQATESSSETDLAQILMDPAALQNPEKEGYLLKQGGSIKTWKKRWFILKGNYLFYFKEKGDANPKGIICLKEGSVETSSADIGKSHAFSIKTPDRQYFMCATSGDDEREWVQVLSKKVGQTWAGAMRMSGAFTPVATPTRGSFTFGRTPPLTPKPDSSS
eukprot:TRINITY_DN11630_c0_g1_i2.p1 TRINITY_DN11630_c0_g1~~TRINITY_DN11630_c0_g1_i2.p1  ORF type:complete len:407 (-),score=70.73 TRINITY_DN11630_c0_g1_i2:356-1531(-)